MDLGEEEEVTWEERKENHEFLTAIMETEVMKEAHRYLVSKGVAPEDEGRFKGLLHGIWFKMFRRGGASSPNSCSFEHVFVGEGRGEEMIGMHNWLQFYLQEKAGNIDYHGYFRRETIRDDEIIRLLGVQFSWKGIRGKPMCSVFIGSSPEFEIAAYTVTLLLDRDGKLDVQLGERILEMKIEGQRARRRQRRNWLDDIKDVRNYHCINVEEEPRTKKDGKSFQADLVRDDVP
ncbi:poly(u)-specific endoribonuclease [Plakobranchus ocellatus]|uniref:Uridylate-specific endoribonuclease n=1 Tax=Plakobranchus ocellatus TaxID=259542 RepID=A0AAV3XUY1_9GAST|nr:poly(u)-specific endoribonuclease [Plakobranchus ocellatus]